MLKTALPAEIALLLCLKLAALCLLYSLFFAHAAPVDAGGASAHLLNP